MLSAIHDSGRFSDRFSSGTAYGVRMSHEHSDGGPDLGELREAALDEDGAIDPRWRALAEGRLAPDEIAEIGRAHV